MYGLIACRPAEASTLSAGPGSAIATPGSAHAAMVRPVASSRRRTSRRYIAAACSASIQPMASADETAHLLERTPMFAGLTSGQLEELAKVAVPRSYEAGQVVFREGDEGDTCFVVRAGAVKI